MYKSASGKTLTKKQLIQEIINFMRADKQRLYRISIGTDSEDRLNEADFAVAIVVHRVGRGGRYFWRRKTFPKFHTLRDRVIQEALLSLETAREILTTLKTYQVPKFDFEVHVDIGEKGETKEMIQEVLGMIRAYHFQPKIKPESYTASNVADRHV